MNTRSETYINGHWVDDKPLNDSVTDKVLVSVLTKRVEHLEHDLRMSKAEVEAWKQRMRKKDEMIEAFKQWREKFIAQTIFKQLQEMKEIMQGKEKEMKMLRLLTSFFSDNQSYQKMMKKLISKYKAMINEEISVLEAAS